MRKEATRSGEPHNDVRYWGGSPADYEIAKSPCDDMKLRYTVLRITEDDATRATLTERELYTTISVSNEVNTRK